MRLASLTMSVGVLGAMAAQGFAPSRSLADAVNDVLRPVPDSRRRPRRIDAGRHHAGAWAGAVSG